MGKRYSKTTRRTKRYTLSPKDAETIIKQEFTDSRGIKTITDVNVKPHKPSTPTIQGIREYKD